MLLLTSLAGTQIALAQSESTTSGDTLAVPAAASAYETIVHDAIAAQSAGDFEAAHALFEQAHELAPNARTLRGMGVASLQGRKFMRALVELRASLVHPNKPLDPALRTSVLELIRRASGEVGEVTLEVSPSDALVAVDGGQERPASELLVLEPGSHFLRLSANGFIEQTVGIDVNRGTRETLRLSLSPLSRTRADVEVAPPKERSDKLSLGGSPYVARKELTADEKAHRFRTLTVLSSAALSVGASVTALGVYLGARHRISEIAKLCERSELGACSVEERDRQAERAHLTRLERGINASLGIAAVSLAGAGALLTWDYFAMGLRFDFRLSSLHVRARF